MQNVLLIYFFINLDTKIFSNFEKNILTARQEKKKRLNKNPKLFKTIKKLCF